VRLLHLRGQRVVRQLLEERFGGAKQTGLIRRAAAARSEASQLLKAQGHNPSIP